MQLQERCLLLADEGEGNGADTKVCILHDVDTLLDLKGTVNKEYIKNVCLCYAKSTECDPIIDARNHKITAKHLLL